VVGLSIVAGIAALFAAEKTPVRAAGDVAAARPVLALVPGGGASPLAPGPKSGPPRVVWTGFQVTDQGSRVFVQTTGSVELELDSGTGKAGVTVTLRNSPVHMRNHSRTLDTPFFATPV